MANHCIDVICLDCGRSWCCRCEVSSQVEPSTAYLEQWHEHQRWWADKYNNGVLQRKHEQQDTCVCKRDARVVME